MRELPYDNSTGAVLTLDYEHHEIHDGRSFVASHMVDLGNGASLNLLITTPNTKRYTHLVINVISEAEGQWVFYETVAATDAGTAIAAINKNRNSANTAGTAVAHTPGGWSVGSSTTLQSKHWGAAKTQGGDIRGRSEFVLAPNTKYGLIITNGTTSNNYFTVWFEWYEHTDKG